jgi:hypothetical protein
MALHVRVRFLDGSEWTRDYPGLSWETRSHQALFSAAIREAEEAKSAEAGETQVHAGAWMEHSTEKETS